MSGPPDREVDVDGRAGSPNGSERITVLHVDDDEAFVDLTAERLERERDGVEVVTANGVDEGLELLCDRDVDCFVCDYDMPEMTGIEVLERVREGFPGVPVVLFTGKGSEAIAGEAMAKGAAGYLRKGAEPDRYGVLADRIEDAVERRRARRELERRERRLYALLENSNDRLSVLDEEGRYRFVSPSMERLTGRDPAELLGESGFEYVHPEDREEVGAVFERLVADPDGVRDVEYRYRHADGSWRWVESRGRNRLDDPTVGGVLVNSRDITGRKERELERASTLELLRDLYDVTTDADLEFDDKVDLLLELGCERFGLSYGFLSRIETGEEGDEPGTQRIVRAHGEHDLLQPGGSCPLREAYCRRTIDSDGLLAVFDAVEEGWESDPAYRRFELGCYIGGKVVVDGDLYGTLCFAGPTPRDDPFTDLERMVVRLMSQWVSYELGRRRMTTELERQRDRLQEFASVLAHDLRNPMAVAQGRLDVVRDEYWSDDLDRVSESLDRMDTLIDDVLALAREGKAVTDPRPVDLGATVRDCWQTVETADATLTVETDRSVYADRSRLRQLLENLVRNAVEHGGGTVTVTVGDLGDGFYMADDGPGIPADEREEVFAAGYTTSTDGTGFGLSIVGEIADAHGWEIEVVEGADGGARFEITGVEFVDG